MGDSAAVTLAVLCALAATYCLARCLVPRWRGDHPIAVDAWHVVMGAAMVVMLLAPVGRRSAALQAGVFALVALWCGVHLLARAGSGAHLRLGVACAVMAAMLVPAAVPVAASAAHAVAPAGSPGASDSSGAHGAHQHVAGMDMSAGSAADPMGGVHAMPMAPVWLAVLMLAGVAYVVLAAVRAALLGAERRPTARLALGGEIVMALAMGWMAALALGG